MARHEAPEVDARIRDVNVRCDASPFEAEERIALENVLARLRAKLDAVRVAAQFEIGRMSEPALAQYQTNGDVLVALQGRGPAEYARCDALVGTLVWLHQWNTTSY